MRFIIVVVIVTGFFAIYMSKYGETKSNNTSIDAKNVPPRLIKTTMDEHHKRQEWKSGATTMQQNCTKNGLQVSVDHFSAERARFELAIPFGGTHAFQACLFSHSSISPMTVLPKRTANIGKI